MLPLRFRFNGGAGSYFLVGLGSALLTIFTFNLATPWAICMYFRWAVQHTTVNGQPVRFTGTGLGLFGLWIKWWLLMFVTLGIYSFWVVPSLMKWIIERTELAVPVPPQEAVPVGAGLAPRAQISPAIDQPVAVSPQTAQQSY